MNIVEPILFQARYQPEAPALCAQGIDVITYARLTAQMNNVAQRAMGSGLRRGDLVALSIDDSMLHAIVILGLTLAGMIPVSVGMYRPPAGLRIDAVLRNTKYPFAPEARHLPVDHGWLMGDGRPADTAPSGRTASAEVCRIVLTSGTTGDPKAIALTHAMVMTRNARFDHVLGNRPPATSRVYMQMGLAAALGYQFLVHALSRGGTLFFHGESVDNTLRAFEVFHIETMLATPTTLVQFLALCDQHPSIDVHVDTIISGGSLLQLPLVERVRPRLCSHLITGYGSTETAISATAPAHRIAHIPGAAGYVTPGIRIEIVDDDDRALAPGREGTVRIASEFAVDRYIDDPAESAQVFRDGWFYPGDIGALTADNLLIISGRQNDVLNVGGSKMAAEKVEAVLLSFKGVNEAAAFTVAGTSGVEEIWAAIVCGDAVDMESLRAHCRPRMPEVFVPARIVALKSLPTTAMGKVDRQRLKETLTAGAAT